MQDNDELNGLASHILFHLSSQIHLKVFAPLPVAAGIIAFTKAAGKNVSAIYSGHFNQVLLIVLQA